MATPTLIHIALSPYSERVRWTLGQRGVAYRAKEHLPLLGELGLRRLARRAGAKPSVPLLVVDKEVHGGSWAASRWADRHGEGETLFPAEHLADIEAWNERSERILGVLRQRSLRRLLESDAAVRESIPAGLRPLPGTLAVARKAIRFLLEKYEAATAASGLDEVREIMSAWRKALGGKQHLLGALSYADITMGVTLQMVEPVAGPFMPLGPATHRVWQEPELKPELEDLLAWRDALYAARPAPPR